MSDWKKQKMIYTDRQTDGSKKPCSHLTSTANRFFWWIKILPVTLFPFKSGANISGKSSTETVVLPLCDFITELMRLYGRWRPCQVGGDEVTKVWAPLTTNKHVRAVRAVNVWRCGQTEREFMQSCRTENQAFQHRTSSLSPVPESVPSL